MKQKAEAPDWFGRRITSDSWKGFLKARAEYYAKKDLVNAANNHENRMNKIPNKKVDLDLTQIDGNAFCLMGAFSKQAKRSGWEKSEIDAVLSECRAGDYDHLVQTLIQVCE